jgi:PAS domain S-box-containing protein
MTINSLLPDDGVTAFTNDLLAKIGEATPDLIYAKDLHSRMIFANRAVLEVLGKSWEEIRGRSDDEWHDDPDEGRKFVEADARVMKSGETEELEEVLTGVSGSQTYLSSKSPLRAQDGRVIGIFGISKNITARKNEERLRQILLNELDHRVKNTLGLVQAMARQTFKNAGIDAAIWAAFEGRLISMSKAHGLLIQQSWVGADIADIVAEGLTAHGGQHEDCFIIAGPPAWVDARTALAMAMAFHELATNATKYGALSVPGGCVTISWELDNSGDVPMLELYWRERGGPPVSAPARKGFGSRLIEQAFAQNRPSIAQVKYLPEGVEFHLRCSVGERLAK